MEGVTFKKSDFNIQTKNSLLTSHMSENFTRLIYPHIYGKNLNYPYLIRK